MAGLSPSSRTFSAASCAIWRLAVINCWRSWAFSSATPACAANSPSASSSSLVNGPACLLINSKTPNNSPERPRSGTHSKRAGAIAELGIDVVIDRLGLRRGVCPTGLAGMERLAHQAAVVGNAQFAAARRPARADRPAYGWPDPKERCSLDPPPRAARRPRPFDSTAARPRASGSIGRRFPGPLPAGGAAAAGPPGGGPPKAPGTLSGQASRSGTVPIFAAKLGLSPSGACRCTTSTSASGDRGVSGAATQPAAFWPTSRSRTSASRSTGSGRASPAWPTTDHRPPDGTCHREIIGPQGRHQPRKRRRPPAGQPLPPRCVPQQFLNRRRCGQLGG